MHYKNYLVEENNMNTSEKSFVQAFKDNYDYLFVDLRDPRVDDWFLMWSVWPTVAACCLYYYVIRIAGPRYMEKRPPFNIKKLIIVYNLCQTIFSFWIFQKACRFWLTGKAFKFPIINMIKDGYDALNMTWWYFFSKYIDYLDSLFFLLTKKFSHLSTLHVVHHGIMPFTAWWGIRYVGGGHTTFCGFLNMGVHVVMYFYYFLAACGPKVQKYLWWKRYLTTLQLVQFVTFFIHACFPMFFDCNFPVVFSYIIIFHGAMFFVMFMHFYIQSYINKGSKGAKSSIANGSLKKDINANNGVTSHGKAE